MGHGSGERWRDRGGRERFRDIDREKFIIRNWLIQLQRFGESKI